MAINPLTQQSFDPGFQFPTPVPTPFGPAPTQGEQSELGTGFYSATPVTTTATSPIQIPQGGGDVLGGSTQQSAPSGGGDMGSLIQQYKDRGWTDEAAIIADINATGGPQQPSGPSPEDLFAQQFPQSDIGSFDLGAGEFQSEIQSQFQARTDYLNQAEQAIRTGQPEILEGIAADLRAGKGRAGTAKGSELGVLKGSEQEARGRKEDVMASSRRLFNELRMGARQRFGGSTSASEAMNTLLGVEQQRQQGQTGREFGQTMQQISRQKSDIESRFQSQLQQLEADNVNSINQANQEFRARLDEVEQNRLLASDAKSEARLTVLQDLRDKAFAINAQRDQFKQQLEANRQQQQLDLDSFAQQLQLSSGFGQQATQGFNQRTTTSPTSDITATGRQSTRPVGITTATGQISDDFNTNVLRGAQSSSDEKFRSLFG